MKNWIYYMTCSKEIRVIFPKKSLHTHLHTNTQTHTQARSRPQFLSKCKGLEQTFMNCNVWKFYICKWLWFDFIWPERWWQCPFQVRIVFISYRTILRTVLSIQDLLSFHVTWVKVTSSWSSTVIYSLQWQKKILHIFKIRTKSRQNNLKRKAQEFMCKNPSMHK